MSTPSASPADRPADHSDDGLNAAQPARRNVLVWDAPVRLFHWLMVLSFAGAYLTAESERWRLVHVTLGYTMVGLVAFRILWGLIGTRYARFSEFVRSPKAVADYLRSLASQRPKHYTGHNPAGALAILALIGLAAAVGASGWAIYNDLGGHWLEETHEAIANGMLALVILHVAAVVFSSWRHRENLVGAMVDGRKAGKPEQGIRRAWRGVAALMLVAVLGFWYVQWQSAPSGGVLPGSSAAMHGDGDHDDDD